MTGFMTWAEQTTEKFFSARKSPTRSQCDQLALSITGASAVRPVDVPGSLSYTVICTGGVGKGDHVVSFRESGSQIDENKVALAKDIHGDLVPHATSHGIVDGSDPPLIIYTMPLLPGEACLEVLSYKADIEPDDVEKHICFIRHLARYFARCWSSPQPVDPQTHRQLQQGIARRLSLLNTPEPSPIPLSTLTALTTLLPRLFASDHPQVLTHNDLSQTNLLVHPSTFEITGIVDWSLASIQPFGLELDSLLLMTGCMDLSGWHDYTCRPQLVEAFWEEFWVAAGIEEEDGAKRGEIRVLAEAAGRVGAVLRYGFERTGSGEVSEVVIVKEGGMAVMLRSWLGREGW